MADKKIEKIEYRTHATVFRDEPESNDGPYLVEEAGYITAKEKIESMIDAGRRLNESRGLYDSDDESFEEDIDPTRKPGIDLAEVSELQQGVSANLEKQKRQADKEQAEKARIQAEKDELDRKEFEKYKNSKSQQESGS